MRQGNITIITWIALGFSLTGNIFINRKSVFGFYFWIISNVLWIIYAVSQEITAQIVLFVVYTVLAFHGIWSWKNSKDM